ncbi:MAG: hypothetical protein RMH93_06485 [Aquificaceae bacterium]|nr:hypothetical protein [Aquificaceae bacterium]MCS7196679.1 hypothetical protein [Aquificaceae bacterium]MDW8033178.1 hypothetical protein [Aquificaceae bacterium]MDW8295076.1 hypothetical protein [Aquificaceae bacterium]
MKVQKLFREAPQSPNLLEPFVSWQEISPRFEEKRFDDCYLLIADISEDNFDSLVGIFQSREEAMGAFLTVAMEQGWEEVPETYCVYHAQEVGGKLVAGLMFDGQISTYEQTTVEQMVQVMAKLHRVVVYSYDVVTYIKDIYPEIDQKVFVLARRVAKVLGRAPELEELAKIYCMPLQSLEDKLRLIDRLLENPVRTPYGEVNIPPFSYPVVDCE